MARLPASVTASVDRELSLGDEDSDVHQQHTRSEEEREIYKNRTKMTFFSFFMNALQCWVSLFLFLASIRCPVQHPTDAIVVPFRNMRTSLDAEAEAYGHCVSDIHTLLHEDLQGLATKETLRVRDASRKNEMMVQQGESNRESCELKNTIAREHLILQQNNSIANFVKAEASCSKENQQKIQSVLNGDVDLLTTDVLTGMDSFTQLSSKSHERLNNYVHDRAEYDHKYFVEQRIQPALEALGLSANTTISMGWLPDLIPLDSFDARIQLALERPKEIYERMVSHIDKLRSRLDEYTLSLEKIPLAYAELYERASQMAEYAAGFLPPGVDIPPFFDVTDLLPTVDSLMPPSFHFPPLDEDFAGVHEAFESVTQAFVEVMQSILEIAGDHGTLRLRGFRSDITELLSSLLTLKDYDPPAFVGSLPNISDPWQEIHYIAQMGEKVRNSTAALLEQQLSAIHLPKDIPDIEFDFEFQNATFFQNGTLFSYLHPELPTINVPFWLRSLISWLFRNTWVTEIILQALRLWKLEKRHNKGAVPDMPVLKCVKCDNSEAEKQTQAWKLKLFSAVFKCCRHLRSLLLLLMMFLFFCFGAMFWYPHVRSSCVATSEGTIFARNVMSPLLLNDASLVGNALYLKAEQSCWREKEEICTEAYRSSVPSFRSQEERLDFVVQSHTAANDFLVSLQSCSGGLDLMNVSSTCCGLKGFSSCADPSFGNFCPTESLGKDTYHSLVDFAVSPTCSSDPGEWILEDAVFNCDTLGEACNNIPCAGIDKELLKKQIADFECAVQTYILDWGSFLFLVVCHFVCMNIICTLLLTGIRRRRWRSLCPAGLKVHCHMTGDGDLKTGIPSELLVAKSSAIIARFEFVGLVQIVAATTLLIAWLIEIVVGLSRRGDEW